MHAQLLPLGSILGKRIMTEEEREDHIFIMLISLFLMSEFFLFFP